jgi:outer membrane protein assembly factor BamD (BamD/ComL family)
VARPGQAQPPGHAADEAGQAPAPVQPAPHEAREAREAHEESLLVAQARQALRSGDSAGALAQLARANERFPRGVLGQEREAIAIEALSGAGQRAQAAERARAFVQANPDSPFAPRLRVIFAR